jgi:hypothetical protein
VTPHGEKACLFLRRPQRDRLEGRRGRFEFCRFNFQTARPSLRAKRSNPFFLCGFMDCFVASLLAMTAIPGTRSRSRGAMRPRFCVYLSPKEGVGNAGCPLHPRPRVHLVVVERTRVTTSTPESPDVPARNGFNGFLRALPGDRACLPPSPADMSCLSPVGPTQLRKLDASVGASGPHDFAVRCNISRPLAVDRSQVFQLALQSHRAQNAAASTAFHPASVTIMTRPSCGVGWREL